MLYEVLDHDATHTDIEAFLGRLKTALDERGLALKGITTDGSALYPEPIRIVFGDVPHQLCTFHMIKDLTKGVLKAVAKERERLGKSKPKLKRGRPSSKDQAARRRARKRKSLQQKISDLFQNRYLFVKRRLKPSERKRLLHITRGLPHLRKLRELLATEPTVSERVDAEDMIDDLETQALLGVAFTVAGAVNVSTMLPPTDSMAMQVWQSALT